MLITSDAVLMAAVDQLEAHKAARPRITRILTDDITPEAMKSTLADQFGATANISAESAILSITAGGRYSNAPNFDVILNAHAADRIQVDRKGRPSETIERACLTLCLMAQRHVIKELGDSPGFVHRGGVARLLVSFPDDNLGSRRIDAAPVPAALSRRWSDIVTSMARRKPGLENGCYVPWELHLSAPAKAVFRAYREWHEPQMSRNGDFGDIRDWAGKQCGAVLRIAGLFHAATHNTPERDEIDADTIQHAIQIVNYYAEHARIMYRLMGSRSGQSDARIVLETIRSLGSPTTRREVHRKLHNRMAFAASDSLDTPLRILEEHGYIKRSRQSGDKGGRPSEEIYLNPLENNDNTDTTTTAHTEARGFVGSVIDSQEYNRDIPDDRDTASAAEGEPPQRISPYDRTHEEEVE